ASGAGATPTSSRRIQGRSLARRHQRIALDHSLRNILLSLAGCARTRWLAAATPHPRPVCVRPRRPIRRNPSMAQTVDLVFPLRRRHLGIASLHRLFPRRNYLLPLPRPHSPLTPAVFRDAPPPGSGRSSVAEYVHASHLRNICAFLLRLFSI